jgi:hypothetical protein
MGKVRGNLSLKCLRGLDESVFGLEQIAVESGGEFTGDEFSIR